LKEEWFVDHEVELLVQTFGWLWISKINVEKFPFLTWRFVLLGRDFNILTFRIFSFFNSEYLMGVNIRESFSIVLVKLEPS